MYYSYQDQISIIKDIRIKENDSRRIICPFCLGVNTFTVTNKLGDILWNCYKASCGVKGIYKGLASVESLRAKLNSTVTKETIIKNPIPSILSDIRNHKFVMDWLENNNSLTEALQNKVCIKYSPKERRVLFFYPDQIGALGRTLIPNHKPKWKQFGDTSSLFIAGQGNLAVVVEDCASAVSVSRLPNVTGIALSGTNMSTKHKHILSKYKYITIALDMDAQRKAKELVSQLTPFSTLTTTLIDKDVKYFTMSELLNKFKMGNKI